MEESLQWLNLPRQLWPVIGEHLDTYIDVLRFRSVCRLWRESLPPLNPNFPISYTSEPDTVKEDALTFYVSKTKMVVFQRIVYGFIPLDHDDSVSDSVSSKGWLGKFESTNLGDMLLSRPYKSNSERKGVNFLDFGIREVTKSYFIGFTDGHSYSPSVSKKVAVFHDSSCKDKNKNRIMVGIQMEGNLNIRKHGDGCWNPIGDKNSQYQDVITYKGKIYALTKEGSVFLIDSPSSSYSSMKIVQISPPLSVCGNLKHFVESEGELYIVDRFVVTKASISILRHGWWRSAGAATVDLKVYRLDQQRRTLLEVNDLGNQAFVLGVDCFAVSAPDFEGFQRNCIYFSHELDSYVGCGYITHVFDLQKTSFMESSLQVLKKSLKRLRGH